MTSITPALRTRSCSRPLTVLVTLVALLAVVQPSASAYDAPPEDYAPYQPQTHCPKSKRAKPGTRALARWIDARYAGGPADASKRRCGGGTSEHQDGRAIDWMMDATTKRDRREVRRLLQRLFRTDAAGNEHALARRMGIMYVIWNDRMWASYDTFHVKSYSGSDRCKATRTCTRTTRHRDHVHISLSRRGGRGTTSWYEGRL